MKNKLRGIIFFLTGVIFTTCFFQFVYPPPKDAGAADRLACIRQDLDAKLYNGNVGEDKKFTIVYQVPSCYGNNGYSIAKTYIYQGDMVAVVYQNPNFKTSAGGEGTTGGGFQGIQ